jgi:hypothetical protein
MMTQDELIRALRPILDQSTLADVSQALAYLRSEQIQHRIVQRITDKIVKLRVRLAKLVQS